MNIDGTDVMTTDTFAADRLIRNIFSSCSSSRPIIASRAIRSISAMSVCAVGAVLTNSYG